MPPSAAVLDETYTAAVGEVHIRPLAEHRHVTYPKLTLISNGRTRRHGPPPGVVEVRRLLTAVLEILDGRRPVAQLAEIVPRQSQLSLLTMAGVGGPGPRTLRSLHLTRTTAEAVDLCARIDHGRRSRALTGRLEQRANRWQFTFLAIV